MEAVEDWSISALAAAPWYILFHLLLILFLEYAEILLSIYAQLFRITVDIFINLGLMLCYMLLQENRYAFFKSSAGLYNRAVLPENSHIG